MDNFYIKDSDEDGIQIQALLSACLQTNPEIRRKMMKQITNKNEFFELSDKIKGEIQELLDYIDEKDNQDNMILDSHQRFDAHLDTQLLIEKIIEIKSMIPYHCDE